MDNNNLNNEFNDDSSVKDLEKFFNKEINSNLTPQELMITALSLAHTVTVLKFFKEYTHMAIFDMEAFIVKYPEYANIDFSNLRNLDKDTFETIGNLLGIKDINGAEEFNKGSILIDSIIKVITNISSKLYDTYTEEYGKVSPVATVEFFTILDQCLENSLRLLEISFEQNL